MTHPAAPAVEALDAHRRYLYAYALRRLKDPGSAEDMVQETFAAALCARDSFKGEAALRTWLTGILKHKIMDEFRRRAREVTADDVEVSMHAAHYDDVESADAAPGDWHDPVHAADADPEYALARQRFWSQFAEHLHRMPAQAAQAFALHDIYGHDTGEVCERLGVTPANLWVILHRARKRLQQSVEPGWRQYFADARR